ncbi:MAG: M14 family metallopeptidase [Caulobacteraceae bacterium]|nr:M14 family metallopeptidase [Caulobacteraceae bacterium]
MTDLLTIAERSDFRLTGRTDEVETLCAEFEKRWPDAVRSFEYGRSAEGRPMRAMLVSRCRSLNAAELQARGVPVLMLQAGIHPGESDGKDAGFMVLRDLLSDPASTLLNDIAVLFVPAFNTDGHERVGRWNRPNQVGPEETGWRATAQNLNLNRDYMKAEAPEMQAMLRLLNEWDPLVCADLHVTDGADFEPDISLQVEPVNQGDAQLCKIGVELRTALIDDLEAKGSIPLAFYPDLVETDNPASGFVLTVYSPRFSTGYFPQRNRWTVLVETHSWKPYATRVRVTQNTITGLINLIASNGAAWLGAARGADAAAAALNGAEMILAYASSWREPTAGAEVTEVDETSEAEMIDFRGYAYTRETSDISGALATIYDPSTPQIWTVPYRNKVKASLVVPAPRGGYAIPAGWAEIVGAKLEHHGVTFSVLGDARRFERAEAFRATHVRFSAGPFEGRMRATVDGAWGEEAAELGAGSLIVPITQPLSRLVMALLEPQAPDSLLSWGFFNACFEQKEAVEPYVAEVIARDIFANDLEARTEFNRRLKEDPAFAASADARLEFFLRRHVSWDAHYMRYPVVRI